jgi:hypothetical protein
MNIEPFQKMSPSRNKTKLQGRHKIIRPFFPPLVALAAISRYNYYSASPQRAQNRERLLVAILMKIFELQMKLM